MSKDWQRGSTFMNDDVKIEKELGVGSDGYQTGKLPLKMTSGTESQTVIVKGTKTRKPQKATWY